MGSALMEAAELIATGQDAHAPPAAEILEPIPASSPTSAPPAAAPLGRPPGSKGKKRSHKKKGHQTAAERARAAAARAKPAVVGAPGAPAPTPADTQRAAADAVATASAEDLRPLCKMLLGSLQRVTSTSPPERDELDAMSAAAVPPYNYYLGKYAASGSVWTPITIFAIGYSIPRVVEVIERAYAKRRAAQGGGGELTIVKHDSPKQTEEGTPDRAVGSAGEVGPPPGTFQAADGSIIVPPGFVQPRT